jgi:hypothetical protein
MYEFLIGVGFGVFGSVVARSRASREVGTQVDDVWGGRPTAPPVMVPVKRKAFVPGELVNFWGKDS